MEVTRRRFLKCTLGTAAACGFARLSTANDTGQESITDTHIYLGHWPHQQLPNNDPAKLVAELRQNGVRRAWIGSFDGLFHKDIAGVNERLADACARTGDESLIPFGTINPTLPDWEEDIRRCHEIFHMPGIRLHPNYHGYTLDDARFARLLNVAASCELIVQLVAWMEDQQHLLLNPQQARVDLKRLADKIAPLPGLRLIVMNGARDDAGLQALLTTKQVYFDLASVDKAPPDRVVFGSCSPLHPFKTALSAMRKAQLNDGDRRAISSGNANRLIAAGQKTSAIEPRGASSILVSTP